MCGSSRLTLLLFEAGRRGAQSVPVGTVDDAEDANVELLMPWQATRLPPLVYVDSDGWDSFRLVEAASLLNAFALVTTDTSDGHVSVSMHPLVHAWARDHQSKDEQHENWLQMGCLIASARKEGELWGLHERQLQPHLEVLTGWEMDQNFGGEPVMLVGRVVVNCGWLLHRMRSDAKLFILIQKTIMIRLKLEGTKVDEEWMGTKARPSSPANSRRHGPGQPGQQVKPPAPPAISKPKQSPKNSTDARSKPHQQLYCW